MLKFIFWCLLGANAVLLALGQGYLGSLGSNEREPERMKNQLNAEKISLVPAPPPAPPATAPAATRPTTALAAKPAASAEVFACTEIGNFAPAEARRFEAGIAPLALGDRQSRHGVPGQEISSYIVNIPAQGGKQGADLKTAELKELGLTNHFIMPDSSPMPWAISLGVFKSEAAAQSLLASLVTQGVHGARVSPRFANRGQLAFRFRDLDSATRARLNQIRTAFPAQEMRGCK